MASIKKYQLLCNGCSLMNISLKNKIAFLKSLNINCNNSEIQVSNIGFYSFSTKIDLDEQQINKLLSDEYLSFLSINKKIYVNLPIVEIINGYIIRRNALSFHQNDDFIRKNVHILIEKNLNNISSILFIGGVMYLFGKIFKNFYKSAYFVSDYISIVNDTILNGVDKNYVEHVNYENYVINRRYDIAICNTGKSGLGNLCNQLKLLNKIIIISCNIK